MRGTRTSSTAHAAPEPNKLSSRTRYPEEFYSECNTDCRFTKKTCDLLPSLAPVLPSSAVDCEQTNQSLTMVHLSFPLLSSNTARSVRAAPPAPARRRLCHPAFGLLTAVLDRTVCSYHHPLVNYNYLHSLLSLLWYKLFPLSFSSVYWIGKVVPLHSDSGNRVRDLLWIGSEGKYKVFFDTSLPYSTTSILTNGKVKIWAGNILKEKREGNFHFVSNGLVCLLSITEGVSLEHNSVELVTVCVLNPAEQNITRQWAVD